MFWCLFYAVGRHEHEFQVFINALEYILLAPSSPSHKCLSFLVKRKSWRKHKAELESSYVRLCFHCIYLNGLYLIDESQYLCLNDFQFPSVSINAVQTHKLQVGFLTLLCWCSFPFHLKWPPELNVIDILSASLCSLWPFLRQTVSFFFPVFNTYNSQRVEVQSVILIYLVHHCCPSPSIKGRFRPEL